MLVKLYIVFTLYNLSGVLMQKRCMQYDFNNIDVANDFKPCISGSQYGFFQLKSYANASFPSFRNDVEYYASNIDAYVLCFRTKESFLLDDYTEIYTAFYQNTNGQDNSSVQGDGIYFSVRFNDINNDQYSFGLIQGPKDEWVDYRIQGRNFIRNVTLEIRAQLTVNSVIAIEYFQVVNPSKAEQSCRRILPNIRTESPTTLTSSTETEIPDPSTTEVTAPSTTEVTAPSTTEVTATSTTEVTAPLTTGYIPPSMTEDIPPSTTEYNAPSTTEVTTTQSELTDSNPTETQTTMETGETQAPSPSTATPPKQISFVYNIYNFMSNFNFTSKIIN